LLLCVITGELCDVGCAVRVILADLLGRDLQASMDEVMRRSGMPKEPYVTLK